MGAQTAAYALRPWTDVVVPHADVRSGELSQGTFAANLAAVAYRHSEEPVYADAASFFAATHLTAAMRVLLRDVFGVLAGRGGDRALQLRTPFGGGKTHTLLALLHLARERAAVADAIDLEGIPDPGAVRVAVLSGEYLDPQRGREVEGRTIRTLWGELAYQLGGWEAYDALLVDGEEGTPPGGERLARLLAHGPTLVLLDEVLVYILKGRAIARGDSNAGQQALLFMQNLTEAVNQQREAAMVYSLQASVGEAVQEEGLLQTLEHITARIDARREPVSGDEVLKVVQRRLFESTGEPDVAREVARAYAGLVERELLAGAETDDERREAVDAAQRLERRIEDSYPFHPELIDLMYQRWGSLPSYQRTRGALQFLATVVHALWERRGEGEPQGLIGPGDVGLGDEDVRASFFEQVGQTNQYAAVVEADFLGAGAGTRIIDERVGSGSPALRRLRVGTRVATSIALLSFGAREGEERGALEREVLEATLVPGLDVNLIRSALRDLRAETLLYLHYTGRRYRFETTPNLNKLVTDEEAKLEGDEVLADVRRRLERALAGAPSREVALWPRDSSQIPDRVPGFVIAYLPLDADTQVEALAALATTHGGGPRSHKNAVALAVPSGSAGEQARRCARTALAIASLLSRGSRLGFSAEQKAELKERAGDAERALASHLGQIYGEVLVPVESDGPGGVRFERVDMGTVLAAGRTLHERIHDALADKVFDSLTARRLVSLSHLAEREAVRCDTLAQSFFSYYQYTKLWSADALRAAIAKGVSEGLFAYATGASGEGADVRVEAPALIQLRSAPPAGEIDLGAGAALLTTERAKALMPTPPEPQPIGTGTEPPPSPPGVIDPTPPPPSVSGSNALSLTIRATEDDLHTLQLALVGLREIVRPGTLRIALTVQAERDGEIDRAQYQNRVRQHLEEDPDVTFEERW
jgi:hypothetical protein